MNKEEKVSKAEELRWLFKKYKNLKQKYDTSRFEEPIAMLVRRDGRVSFFEKVTQGRFDFAHSDGSERSIYVDPKWLKTFPYGEKEFRGYILDEDSPTPLPTEPTTTTEHVQMALEKSMHDISSLKAKEIKAKGDLVWKIALGVGVIICAVILYKMVVPAKAVAPAVVDSVVDTIKHNVTTQSISIIK